MANKSGEVLWGSINKVETNYPYTWNTLLIPPYKKRYILKTNRKAKVNLAYKIPADIFMYFSLKNH